MDKFETSLSEGAHKKLNAMKGSWKGTAKVWFEPGEPVDTSTQEGTIRPVLDGRFMLHEYKGSFQGKPLEGIVIYGYNLTMGTFQSAWIDSFHTGGGILFSEAKGNDQFSVLTSYSAGEGQPAWGWRTEIEMPDEHTLVITAYNIMPEGMEVKATETIYKRVIANG